MDTSAATVNSQFVLSARIRRKLGIRKNVRVTFIERDSRLIIQPLDKSYFDIMAGILGSKGEDDEGVDGGEEGGERNVNALIAA